MEAVFAELRQHLRDRGTAMPETVELVGQRFTIEQTADSRYLGQDNAGKTRPYAQAIHIAADLGPDQARDTLLHEVIHSLLLVMGVDDDERVTGILAPLLLDALRRNPHLAEYLLA